MDGRTPRPGPDWGAIVFGVVLLGIGGYLLLRDTLKIDLPEISWSMVWPVVLVALGVVVILRASGRDDRRRRW